MHNIENHLKSNIAKHMDFYDGRINTLRFTETCAGYSVEDDFADDTYKPVEILSIDYLHKHAYDMGVHAAKRAVSAAKKHMQIGDDWHPYINVDWGTGYTAAMISGAGVVFQKSTSYTTNHVIDDITNYKPINFNPDNELTSYVVQFWQGVTSELESDYISVVPYMYRSPLDLANDMRGNGIFYDMYDYPDSIIKLVDYCADSIITLDKYLREKCPILNRLPGGVWGSVFDKSAIFLNGDPVDLISLDMGKQFNTPAVEKLVGYADNLYFHHHSIGYNRANLIGSIKGLAIQEILQDMNGPKLYDIIDEKLIEASENVPIRLDIDLTDRENKAELLDMLSKGRFILSYE